MNDLIQSLESALPPVFAEQAIPDLMPGLYSRGYLANLRSRGEGPQCFKIGRRTMYRRDDFIDWLTSKMEEV